MFRGSEKRLEYWLEDIVAQQAASLQERAGKEDQTCSQRARDLGEEGRGKGEECRACPAQSRAVGWESGEHLHC